MSEMFEKYQDCVTVEELQEMLHLGRTTVYSLLKRGEIKTVKVGNKYVIPKKCVIEYINNFIS